MSAWTERVYMAVDALDVDGLLSHLTEDAWVRFGNADPVVGEDAIRRSDDLATGGELGERLRVFMDASPIYELNVPALRRQPAP